MRGERSTPRMRSKGAGAGFWLCEKPWFPHMVRKRSVFSHTLEDQGIAQTPRIGG
jgi:hypothetical protein